MKRGASLGTPGSLRAMSAIARKELTIHSAVDERGYSRIRTKVETADWKNGGSLNESQLCCMSPLRGLADRDVRVPRRSASLVRCGL